MLHATLPFAVTMPSYIDAIAKALQKSKPDITRADVLCILDGENIVLNGGTIVLYGEVLKEHPHMQAVTDNTRTELTDEECYIGPYAISYLLRLDGQNPENVFFAMDEIEIPSDVFYYASPQTWHDICTLFVRAENRASRVARLLSIGNLPIAITVNEYRMLWESIVQMNDNGAEIEGRAFRPIMRDDNRRLRCLKDVDYDLEYGWSEKMQAYFDKLDEEYNRQKEEEEEEEGAAE